MEKWRQQFSVGYFVIAIVILIALQSFFAPSRQETIAYSKFKALVRKGLVTNLVIAEKAIHGDIKAEGIKKAIPRERLKPSG